jgi:hypothetical protein
MPTECRNADLDDVILLHSRSLQTLWPNVRKGDLNAHQQSEALVELEMQGMPGPGIHSGIRICIPLGSATCTWCSPKEEHFRILVTVTP